MSFSMVYVGGHYPLDVLGGVLLVVGVAFACKSAIMQIDPFLHHVIRAIKKIDRKLGGKKDIRLSHNDTSSAKRLTD